MSESRLRKVARAIADAMGWPDDELDEAASAVYGKAARAAIEAMNEIAREQYDAIVAACENPPPPNEKLKEMMRNYKAALSEKP